ncbi:hypothetical protein O9929_16145 [Vibrio lentus]|nr:hypothetical protein [Vibrio lentus]
MIEQIRQKQIWYGLVYSIVIFGLLGYALVVNVDGAPVTLSVSGGVLIGGLILVGRFGTIYVPTFVSSANRHNGL